jgi:uncharacterized RmlC-like cupin family protein
MAQAPAASAAVRLVQPATHTHLTTQTAGMERWQVLADPDVWVGVTRTAPGSTSGWHHHGDYSTYIYVQAGRARFEFGPQGRDSCQAVAGDLLHVPRGAIHREANDGAEESVLLIFRVASHAGAGEPVYNVDCPAGED